MRCVMIFRERSRPTRRDEATTSPDGGTSAELSNCAICGRRIDVTKWHRLATETDEDDVLRVYAFCSRECYERRTATDRPDEHTQR
jgi:hypothetical protein